jgi:hypothetical protein
MSGPAYGHQKSIKPYNYGILAETRVPHGFRVVRDFIRRAERP